METGVLLPIFSLPNGRFADGYKFVDWLVANQYKYWQVLPLNPRDNFGSPYNSPNSFQIDSKYGTLDQWLQIKEYANQKGIKIIGDLPYFITRKERNDLFINGLTAGAPPDYYRKTGQHWGLPVYDWETKFDQNLEYLLKRIRHAVMLFDIVRLDHFRGYEAVWVYPKKRWLKVPGGKILSLVKKEFPKQVFIAEDLGAITPGVEKLRKKFKFLGTKVLIWQNPKTVNADDVLYTSIHDTETLHGKFKSLKCKGLIQGARISKAKILIFAMQDILGLGNAARLNKPGTKKGNWVWKLETI